MAPPRTLLPFVALWILGEACGNVDTVALSRQLSVKPRHIVAQCQPFPALADLLINSSLRLRENLLHTDVYIPLKRNL
jgi:hypothetical protein